MVGPRLLAVSGLGSDLRPGSRRAARALQPVPGLLHGQELGPALRHRGTARRAASRLRSVRDRRLLQGVTPVHAEPGLRPDRQRQARHKVHAGRGRSRVRRRAAEALAQRRRRGVRGRLCQPRGAGRQCRDEPLTGATAAVYLEAVSGQLPQSRVSLSKGSAGFRVGAFGLEPGAVIRVKAGFRFFSGLAEHHLRVV